MIRMNPMLHAKLKLHALNSGKSLNQTCVRLIERELESVLGAMRDEKDLHSSGLDSEEPANHKLLKPIYRRVKALQHSDTQRPTPSPSDGPYIGECSERGTDELTECIPLETILSRWNDLIGIFLFGSAARNEMTASSDVDLLLVFPLQYPIGRKLYAEWDRLFDSVNLERVSPHFVSLKDFESNPGSLWCEVALEGIALFEKGGEVSSFLSKLRRAMAEGRLHRRQVYGQPYWIWKDGSPA